MKTIQINDADITFGTIKVGIGRRMKTQYPDTEDYNVAFVAESLKAGGNTEATPEWVDANVNYFDFNKYLAASFEANGFKVETPKVGEAKPPVEAVELTSDTSTQA